MSIVQSIVKNSLLYLTVFTALIMLAFFPRTVQMTFNEETQQTQASHTFSWEEYRDNVSNFVGSLITEGDLGSTRFESVSVIYELKRSVPNSLVIMIPAFFLSVGLGILKGIFDYRNRANKKVIVGNGLTWMFQSVPDFFIISCLIWGVTFFLPQFRLLSQNTPYSFLLPTILVTLIPLMYTARMTSSSLGNEEGNYYIVVARSKGFTEKMVIHRHMLKNALKNVLSHMTSIMVHLLTSIFIVEYFLGYEGMGYRLFTATGYRISYDSITIHPAESGVIVGIGIVFILLLIFSQIVAWLIMKSMKIE